MTIPLCARDFKRGIDLDMWSSLVDEAIRMKLLPENTDPDSVDIINVEIENRFITT